MDNSTDLEIVVVEDEPCEPLLINDIDANGYLVGSDANVGVLMGTDTEGDNDNGVMGMVFDSPDDAYAFYNQYALLHGFGIRIHTTYKNRITKQSYRKIYVCNKEGFKEMKGDTSIWNLKKRRRDLRTGCEAKIRISKRKDGKWFVDIFNAIKCRRKAEEDEDFKTMNSRPVLSSVNPIEAKAGTRYTSKIFEVFQKEWIEATSNLTHETLTKSVEEIIYKVGKLDIEKKYWSTVSFRLSSKVDVKCSCAKFETYGILCKHILYVLKKKHVETLPDHYILPRWTLDARYKEDSCSVRIEDIDSESAVSALTLWCVQSNSTKAIEQAKDSVSEIKKLNTLLLNFLEEQTNRKGSKEAGNLPRDSNVKGSQVNMMPQISVRDPLLPTVTKGRPKKACRIKSSLEAPKKKTCSYCKGLGHYITGCPTKKLNDALLQKDK